jgi:hypothetical protein
MAGAFMISAPPSADFEAAKQALLVYREANI